MPGILIGYAVIRGCNITTNLKFEMIKMIDLRKEKMQFFMQLEQSVGGMMQQSFSMFFPAPVPPVYRPSSYIQIQPVI